MKNVFATLAVLMMATSAMADVDTICQGGGRWGNDVRIEIAHVLGAVGSRSDKALMNDQPIVSTFQGQVGETLTFNLQTYTRVYTLDYNPMIARAVLTGQGVKMLLYCSRGIR